MLLKIFGFYCYILEHLRKVHFKTKEGEEVYFDENGDPPAKYEIINSQISKDHEYEFVTVGLYDSSLPIKTILTVIHTLDYAEIFKINCYTCLVYNFFYVTDTSCSGIVLFLLL